MRWNLFIYAKMTEAAQVKMFSRDSEPEDGKLIKTVLASAGKVVISGSV